MCAHMRPPKDFRKPVMRNILIRFDADISFPPGPVKPTQEELIEKSTHTFDLVFESMSCCAPRNRGLPIVGGYHHVFKDPHIPKNIGPSNHRSALGVPFGCFCFCTTPLVNRVFVVQSQLFGDLVLKLPTCAEQVK